MEGAGVMFGADVGNAVKDEKAQGDIVFRTMFLDVFEVFDCGVRVPAVRFHGMRLVSSHEPHLIHALQSNAHRSHGGIAVVEVVTGGYVEQPEGFLDDVR